LRYAESTIAEQSTPTIGVDFKIKTLSISGKTVKLQIWDTAGQEKFRNITTSYYRGAHGIVVVFDTTNADTFRHLQSWLLEVERYLGNESHIKKLLIGNKVDLTDQRQVTTEQIQKFAENHKLSYIETSAKDATNIDSIFTTMAKSIIADFHGAGSFRAPQSQQETIRLKGQAVVHQDESLCC